MKEKWIVPMLLTMAGLPRMRRRSLNAGPRPRQPRQVRRIIATPSSPSIGKSAIARQNAMAEASESSPPTAFTGMSIASASKWVWGAYVAEVKGLPLGPQDTAFLNMTSGYTNLSDCSAFSTINSCLASGSNATQTPANVGLFYYNGGHFEVQSVEDASAMPPGPLNLGADSLSSLSSAIKSVLGSYHTFFYTQPLLAGGLAATPNDYGAFLRDILSGTLSQANAALGISQVCGSSACDPFGTTVGNSPVSSTGESWNYSLGHWVETDPTVGDGAFSSAGAFGFYPWIDASKTWYGILARDVSNLGVDDGYLSATCGRQIRKAWVTGTSQLTM